MRWYPWYHDKWGLFSLVQLFFIYWNRKKKCTKVFWEPVYCCWRCPILNTKSTASHCAFGCQSVSPKLVHFQTISRWNAALWQPQGCAASPSPRAARRSPEELIISQVTQRPWQQQLRLVSLAKLNLCHRADLFLSRRADENKNRGGEGEREVV